MDSSYITLSYSFLHYLLQFFFLLNYLLYLNDRRTSGKSIGCIQKQPPEVFCKKRCSEKFRKIPRKTPVPESLFCPQSWNFIKEETLAQVFSCEFLRKEHLFYRTPFLQNTSGRLLLNCLVYLNDWRKNDTQGSFLYLFYVFNPVTTNVSHHIKNSQLICSTNQLTGFYMTGNFGR